MNDQADVLHSKCTSMLLTGLQQPPCNALLPVPLVYSHVCYDSTPCWKLCCLLITADLPYRDGSCAHDQVFAGQCLCCSICRQTDLSRADRVYKKNPRACRHMPMLLVHDAICASMQTMRK